MKELRMKINISQSELARNIGVTQSYISKLEKGDGVDGLTIGKLVRIADALQVCPSNLLERLLKNKGG